MNRPVAFFKFCSDHALDAFRRLSRFGSILKQRTSPTGKLEGGMQWLKLGRRDPLLIFSRVTPPVATRIALTLHFARTNADCCTAKATKAHDRIKSGSIICPDRPHRSRLGHNCRVRRLAPCSLGCLPFAFFIADWASAVA